MTQPKHLIAVDLGSNSFHLVVAIEQAGCIKIIHSQKQKVFLASGLSTENVLSQSAIDRGIDCLKQFNKNFTNLKDVAVRVVATYTLRRAINSSDFLDAAYKVFPYPIEIIDGACEAELIFQGVVHTEPVKGRTLVIDIGGGSTELVIGENFKPNLAHSFTLGSNVFHQQFFKDGPLTPEKFSQAQSHARNELLPIADHFRQLGWKAALGTSGSIKAIRASIFELYKEDRITYKHLKLLKRQLINWQYCEQFELKTIDDKRLPLLAPALAILISCFEMLCIPKLSYCSAALREGVLYGMSNSRPSLDIHQRTIDHLCHLHVCNPSFNIKLIDFIDYFNSLLKKNNQPLSKSSINLLQWSAHLHEIGINISRRKRQQHSKYIIQHSEMPGFSEQQQETIALLVGAHRGKINLPLDQLALMNEPVAKLVQLFRLAIILTRHQLAHNLLTNLTFQENKLTIELAHQINEPLELINLLDNEVKQQRNEGFSFNYHTLSVR